ncbi:unnamed protein product [Caenorhabditis auriculariae]|uniref:Phosphatidylserine synthase n=1 Tax=Caenorhabditis auriculariae TaxID=2777116 RepID=A0A8S1GX08_9PELO|nr:unnamed protein product [Caenorhabditis auriculariae]
MTSGSDLDHDLDAAAKTNVTDENEDLSERKRRRRSKRYLDMLEKTRFEMVNERVVEDITLEFFYKPHTLTVLVLLSVYFLYNAFVGSKGEDTKRNVYDGLLSVLMLFIVVSALAFPNGPFIRPHPIVWRIIFGLSVIYMLILQFCLFQTYNDVKSVLSWLDPEGLSLEKLAEKNYAVNCSDISMEKFLSNVDFFAFAHFTGWAMKALLIRHGVMCWYISICWEVTEMFFTQLLPNFAECWWDALVLDILLCNGLGIWLGLKICHFFEMRNYHWESIKDIDSGRGRFKRVVLQFTPESWSKWEWSAINDVVRRTFAVYLFVIVWLMTELNTFFLKHIFAIDTQHPVVFWRIILIAFISAPSIKQYYLYATDPLVKRLGMQCWVYGVVTILEAAICVKFGSSMFPALTITPIIVWILLLAVTTFLSVWISVWCAQRSSATRQVRMNGEQKVVYLDSSHENLGAIQDEVRRRRRDLGFSESDLH